MHTTLRIDDEIYRRAKTKAEEQRMSLTKFVEEAISEHLDRPAPSPRQRRLRLPVSSATGRLGTRVFESPESHRGRRSRRRPASDGLDWWNPAESKRKRPLPCPVSSRSRQPAVQPVNEIRIL